MKIKKVAQTPGVLATVSTSKIDSDKDTYSCNYLNDNAVVVSPTEPSDGKVWIDNVNKKIHTKNDNGYEEFYNEENFNEKITNLTMDMANKLTKVFNRGAEGGSTLDTGLTISGGYGGGCYLVVNTWHLSVSAGGLKVSLLALPVESGTFKEYVVCDIKTNESHSKGFILSVSENNTLKVNGADGGAFHTTIYRL